MKQKKDQVTEKSIAIIGLGYVGLPLAVAFGQKRAVIAFDIDCHRITELKKGYDYTKECSSQDILTSSGLLFSSDQKDLQDVQVYIVTVPTPVDDAHRPDLRSLCSASTMVGSALRDGDTVVFESTVYPGATEEICVPLLESASGLIFNKNFFCGYSPERVNPGDKINTLATIKKITSGSTPETAVEIDELYSKIIPAGTWPVSSMKVAEASKVIENSQRDLNIAFVNELSMIFDRLDIDTIEVLKAAGSKWNFLPFWPGMVGGHCIGVDPYYLTHKAEEVGYIPQVILSGRRINDDMACYAARGLVKRMLKNGIDVARSTVGVLGITFKENCPDVRNSKVVDLVVELEAWGVQSVIIDQWASEAETLSEYGLTLTELENCLKFDSIVVAVGHKEFREMTPKQLRNLCEHSQNPVLADLKSLYDKSECENVGFNVFRL